MYTLLKTTGESCKTFIQSQDHKSEDGRDLRAHLVQTLHFTTEETEAQGVCYLPKVTQVVSEARR